MSTTRVTFNCGFAAKRGDRVVSWAAEDTDELEAQFAARLVAAGVCRPVAGPAGSVGTAARRGRPPGKGRVRQALERMVSGPSEDERLV